MRILWLSMNPGLYGVSEGNAKQYNGGGWISSLQRLFEDDEDAEEQIYEIIENFDNLAGKNKIEIFRILHLNSLSDLNKIELGECWAWNRKTALNFGYENVNDANFMLHGFTSPKNIDWKESVKRYAIN